MGFNIGIFAGGILAGFILGKLGASFEETVGAVRQLPDDENEDPYSSHPHEQLRVEAVVEGYNNAVGGLAGLKLNEFEGDNNAKAYIYYYNAMEKYSEGDIDGALIDINKAIVNKRGFPAAYIVRAQLKNELGDPYGSIGDLNDAIRLNPNLDDLYVDPDFRGKKVAKSLINYLKSLSLTNNWGGIRWLTHSSNKTAKKLYDKIANNTGFELYEIKRH
mgnify:CR=1 FL=1